MTAARIYVVSEEGQRDRLINATSAAQSIRHCAKRYKARVATQADLVRLLELATEVEKAKGDDDAKQAC